MTVDVGGRIDQESDTLPEVGDGGALQGQHEPEDQADDCRDGDDSPQNVGVYFADGEAEQSNCDGNLRDCADPDVAGLTEPPPLSRALAYRLADCPKWTMQIMRTYKHGGFHRPPLQ